MSHNEDQYLGGQIPGVSPAPMPWEGGKVAPTTPLSAVDSKVSELGSAINRLGTTIETLTKRLGHVLRPRAPSAPNPQPAVPAQVATSKLVGDLDGLKKQLTTMETKLEDLTKHLDL